MRNERSKDSMGGEGGPWMICGAGDCRGNKLTDGLILPLQPLCYQFNSIDKSQQNRHLN